MEQLLNFIYENSSVLILGLAALVIILILILIISMSVMSSRIKKLNYKYRKFMIGTSGENIEEIIEKNIDKIKETYERYNEIEHMLKNTNSKLDSCVQNVGFIKFRAFDDIGGELSYALALLDGNADGVIVTSIFGRNQSTTYAKIIEKGISKLELSKEEKQALEMAMSKRQ